MSFHEILIWIMGGFAVLGAIDRILGNRFGMGKEFEDGIIAMGALALAMVGIICLAPVLADLLKVAGKPMQKVADLQEELPLDEYVAMLAAVPGVAMYLAQSEGDGDSYNRWATEYVQRRRMAARPHGAVKDTVPWPVQ